MHIDFVAKYTLTHTGARDTYIYVFKSPLLYIHIDSRYVPSMRNLLDCIYIQLLTAVV